MSSVLEPALSEALKPEDDSDAYWAAVSEVQKREPREVWSALHPLVTSPQPALRGLVPDVLRFLGGTAHPLLEESVTLLRQMLSVEQHPSVLAAIGTAFVDLRHPAVVELLLPLTRHETTQVRSGALHGLLQELESVVPRMVELAADPEAEIRNWAFFALGCLAEKPAQVEAVREALARGVDDPHDEARAEAVLGLAHCCDPRAIEPTRAALLRGAKWDHYEEAAELLISAGLGADVLRQALSRTKDAPLT